MSDVVLRVENLWKEYRLGTIGHGTLYRDLQSGWARFRGREDPNAKIGASHSNQLYSTNDRFWALEDISFDVHRGEVVGVIGCNGAGKSTLLKIISRVTAPTRGSVKIKGRVASLLEVGTGFHPELSGRENIFLNGAILGMNKRETEQKFDEIVRFAEIEQFIDTPVKRYSSGMYVRLAFAVAAHLDPEILIVDEVLAVGDAGFQKKCIGKMNNISKCGRTVLVVSHNMGLIRNLCNRVIFLKTGNIVCDGTSDSVIAEYQSLHIHQNSKVCVGEFETNIEGVIRRHDPMVKILEISLEDSNGILKNSFFSDEKIVVKIKFSNFKLNNNVIAKIILESENDDPILMTQTLDDVNTINEFSNLKLGNYTAICAIPANIFGHRHFFITVHLICPLMEHIIIKKVIEYDIIFKPFTNMVYGSDVDAFIRPQLSWDMSISD